MFISYLVIQMNFIYADSHVWIYIDIPDKKPVEGSVFTTDVKIASWRGAPGALDLIIHYNPKALELIDFSISEETAITANYYIDSTTKMDEWRLAYFQLENDQDIDSIQTICSLSWLLIDASFSSTDIDLEVKELVEFSWNLVEVYAFGQHIEFFPGDTTLLPNTLELDQNYPNPFNYYTIIEYHIPEETNVTLSVFNISGQLISTLVNEKLPQGNYKTVWKGKDNEGYTAASGVYFYQLEAGSLVKNNKMLFLK